MILRFRVVLHTTRAMETAWAMYERLGFERHPDLDFMRGTLEVIGFSLGLAPGPVAIGKPWLLRLEAFLDDQCPAAAIRPDADRLATRVAMSRRVPWTLGCGVGGHDHAN